MKNLHRIFLVILCLAMLSVIVYTDKSSEVIAASQYTLTVNGKVQDLSNLPYALYDNNGCVMIPLSKTAKALGYTVTWLPKENGIRIDDSIQSATVHNGSSTVNCVGKLKVINLTRDFDLGAKVKIWRGCAYVPAEIFKVFFNDITIRNGNVSISPQVCTLD